MHTVRSWSGRETTSGSARHCNHLTLTTDPQHYCLVDLTVAFLSQSQLPHLVLQSANLDHIREGSLPWFSPSHPTSPPKPLPESFLSELLIAVVFLKNSFGSNGNSEIARAQSRPFLPEDRKEFHCLSV